MSPRFTRRRLLVAGLAALAVAGLAFSLRPLLSGRIEVAIAEVFGPEIAAHPDTRRFIADFTEALGQGTALGGGVQAMRQLLLGATASLAGAGQPEYVRLAVDYFLRSTNAVRAHETGVAFEYVAFFDPYAAPCANQLSAGAL